MAQQAGYISVPGTITVRELQEVLTAADPAGVVEIVPNIHTGVAVPLRAAMANLEDPAAGNVLLYLDHPGES